MIVVPVIVTLFISLKWLMFGGGKSKGDSKYIIIKRGLLFLSGFEILSLLFFMEKKVTKKPPENDIQPVFGNALIKL